MTLEDFLYGLDKGLREYEKKAAKEEKKENKVPSRFYQYLAAYMTEGSPANLAVKKSVSALLKDDTFLQRIGNCMEYVVAMSVAAVLSSRDEEEINNE